MNYEAPLQDIFTSMQFKAYTVFTHIHMYIYLYYYRRLTYVYRNNSERLSFKEKMTYIQYIITNYTWSCPSTP